MFTVVMGTPRGSWGSRQPRKGKESNKEPKDEQQPKKTLHDACKELKVRLLTEEREKARLRKDEAQRGEDEALMEATYGPRWRETG